MYREAAFGVSHGPGIGTHGVDVDVDEAHSTRPNPVIVHVPVSVLLDGDLEQNVRDEMLVSSGLFVEPCGNKQDPDPGLIDCKIKGK